MGETGHSSDAPGRPTSLKLLGGRLCLDFANTVDPRHGERTREYLEGYEDLVSWAEHAGVLGPGEVEALLRRAAHRPEQAAAVLRRAWDLRGAIYGVFSAVAAGGAPPRGDLTRVNAELAAAMAHARVVKRDGGHEWGWEDGAFLDRVLWDVARSAAHLLTTGEPERVRECPGEDGCGWLFYDESKNGRRRWCSMEVCGNRFKARRYQARRKKADPATSDTV